MTNLNKIAPVGIVCAVPLLADEILNDLRKIIEKKNDIFNFLVATCELQINQTTTIVRKMFSDKPNEQYK